MVGGDAYAQDATTVTSAGPSTSLTNKTSSPRNASNRSPTTAFTDVHVSVDTSSTKIFGDEAVQPLTTPQLTGQWARIEGRLSHEALVLLLPVRDARLGARGGGDVEEDAHRFSRFARLWSRFSRLPRHKSHRPSSAWRETQVDSLDAVSVTVSTVRIMNLRPVCAVLALTLCRG